MLILSSNKRVEPHNVAGQDCGYAAGWTMEKAKDAHRC